MTQFEIPFVYLKRGGSFCKFCGGDEFLSTFLLKMDFNSQQCEWEGMTHIILSWGYFSYALAQSMQFTKKKLYNDKLILVIKDFGFRLVLRFLYNKLNSAYMSNLGHH